MMPADAETERSLSVFLSNYNHGRFLPAALDALLNQSLRPGAIYVVDDASTDGSQAVIEDYARRFPAIIHATLLPRNRGFVANANDWLSDNTSDFVMFAAADDVVAPDLFRDSLELLRQVPEAGLCTALSRIIDVDGQDRGPFLSRRPLERPGYIPPNEVRRRLMREEGWFMGNTAVFRGPALRAVGFDLALGAFADGFACRVLALRHGACFIPRELANWRRMPGGMAAEATAKPAVAHAIASRGVELMDGPYADLFPHGYARRWRQRWLFWTIAAALQPTRQRARIAELSARLPARDRYALAALTRLPPRVARIGAFLWMRPFDVSLALENLLRRTR